MEVAYTPHFERQCQQYRFCFTCDDCAHFDDHRDVCLHGFPNQMHRRALYQGTPPPKTILFCKDFDLA